MSRTYFLGRGSSGRPERNGASSSQIGSHLSWAASTSYCSRGSRASRSPSAAAAGAACVSVTTAQGSPPPLGPPRGSTPPGSVGLLFLFRGGRRPSRPRSTPPERATQVHLLVGLAEEGV